MEREDELSIDTEGQGDLSAPVQRDEELAIEHEGGATTSLSDSIQPDTTPADPDLVVVRDAAEEFGISAKPAGEAVADESLIIDRTGFNSPDVKTGENPYRVARSAVPPPKRIAVEPPPPEPDLDAIYGTTPTSKDSKSPSVNWDDAFLTPAPSKKRPPSGAFQAPPMPAPSRQPSARDLRPVENQKDAKAKQKEKSRRVVIAHRVTPPAVIKAGLAALGAGCIFIAATVLTALEIEPFHSWYYILAWYPFLLVLNWLAARKSPRLSLFEGRARDVAHLFAWSVPAWLVFELWNFRIQNWYYVGVPDVLVLRWTGILLSFATVLPGIFFFEEVLSAHGAFTRVRRAPIEVSNGLLRACTIGGVVLCGAILALPDFFFAFVWAVPTLLLEPWLFRRDHPSLLQDLSEGRPGRLLRLMAAGLGCGLFWELANSFPGGKWIYTVPWVGSWKIFEMPVLGFIGFAPFGVACWSIARTLVEIGVLPEWIVSRKHARTQATSESEDRSEEDSSSAPQRPALAPAWKNLIYAATALLCAFTLVAMDRWTIDSVTARPERVPAIPEGIAEYAHRKGCDDVRGLLGMINHGLLYMPGDSSARMLNGLAERCRIILLRGIGTENAMRLYRAGITSRADLAAQNPEALTAALAGSGEPGWSPKPRRVQVWIEAAQAETAAR